MGQLNFSTAQVNNILSSVNAPLLTAGSVSAATVNSTALQAAANNGGTIALNQPGVYYVGSTCVLPSNTLVYIGPGVELRQVPGANAFNFFINALFTPIIKNVASITYAGITDAIYNSYQGPQQVCRATVNYASGYAPADLVAGEYVIIDGDPAFFANGGHLVESVGSSSITFIIGTGGNVPSTTQTNGAVTFQGTITGSIYAPLLTVSSPSANTLVVGQRITGTNVPANTFIQSLGTGTGGAGTYHLNNYANISAAESMTAVAQQIVISRADVNVGVVGTGKLNGNYVEGGVVAQNTYVDHAICFNNVIRPVVGGMGLGKLVINDMAEFCVLISRAVQPLTNGIHSDGTGKDGVHYVGPIFDYPIISDVTGSFGDDAAAFENSPNFIYSVVLPPNAGGNFYGGGLMQNIKPDIDGNTGQAVLYPAQSNGNGGTYFKMYGQYDIKNVGHKAPLLAVASGSAFSIGAGYSYDTGYIDEVCVDGVYGGIFLANTLAAKQIYVGKLDIKNWSIPDINDSSSIQFDYFSCPSVRMDVDIYANNPTSENFVARFVSSNVNIGLLAASGSLTQNGSGTLSFFSNNAPGATVDLIKFSDMSLQMTMPAGSVQLTDWNTGSLGNTPKLELKDIYCGAGVTNLVSIGGTQGAEISVDNVNLAGNIFNLWGSGSITVDMKSISRSGGTTNFVNAGASPGEVTIINAQACDVGVQRFTPSSGATVSAYNMLGAQRMIISPSATIAALTLALPANPINNEWIEIFCLKAVTALTTTNGNIAGITSGSTGLAAGFSRKIVYSSSDSMWI